IFDTGVRRGRICLTAFFLRTECRRPTKGVLVNKTTALVVIDVQVGIMQSPRADSVPEVLERISLLLRRARASGTPIIYVQHDGPKGHELEVNSPGWRIHPAISRAPGERCVRKKACDSFFATTLQSELDVRGIRHLIITG